MEKEISRRSFLQKSVITMGTAVVYTFSIPCSAEQLSKSKTSVSTELREETMPHVSVKLYPGRSEQQKVQLAEAIVRDVVDIIQCGEGSISVAIEDIDPQDWKEKVYLPEIVGKSDKLYKKPGYSM